ncbi:DUF4249 domain-containing protein [Chryseolinea sp. H1M3-3]|uniref:DUF4249 domain-containing protein n=1 Tax=Chryseolinea sp. H1M3-3 TaxID=3034144 RepID=UPI0023EC7449|nr:DUF4249 domain-containing protein [Chryseolinea sp. H1M3-3]
MRRGVCKLSVVLLKQLPLAMVLILSGCLPDPLDVNGLPVVKPQIVVSTQIIPDQSLIVFLTKTFGALNGSDDSDPEELLNQIAVDDATVTISGPGGTYELLALENGLYGGLIIPFEEGQEYELRVTSASLGEVKATTTVKPLVTFEDIKAELVFNGFDDTLAQITYRLSDALEQNWYMINVQQIERDELVDNLLNPRAFIRLLDDEAFNGETYQETFRVFPRDFIPGDTIAVSLSNVSKEYYDFINLRQENRFSFVEYLSEPVNYPSNVVGGKGFFNLYIPDVETFILEY